MSEVIFKHSSGLVLIEETVVDRLNGWRQVGTQAEAGGILIGYRRPPHIHVTACTMPFDQDRRSRFGFLRCDPKHAQVARKYWKETAGHAYYLGDWHTHPVANPTPSFVDHKGWKKLMSSKLGTELLFVIVGGSNWYVQLGASKLKILS
jgi:integrative and conjugative element protein (TIGR02256 family)